MRTSALIVKGLEYSLVESMIVSGCDRQISYRCRFAIGFLDKDRV